MVTYNVDAVNDSHVGDHARFVSHDVVNFVFSVSIRTSTCPSHPCFLLKLCVKGGSRGVGPMGPDPPPLFLQP